MNREANLNYLRSFNGQWDIIVIGGGATGLGVAVDAASRGFRTLLLEQSDFAKGTSSRSTKLVHGGVRYLEQGNLKLVLEALKERGILLKNAPHLTTNQRFVIPVYSFFRMFYYAFGLKLYDWLSGNLSLGKSEIIDRQETIRLLPAIQQQGLRFGIVYHDGKFDDTRLAVSLAQTCSEAGGFPVNYMKVTGFAKSGKEAIDTVYARDLISDMAYTLKARVVVNATGVFTDSILQLDSPGKKPTIRPSQGTHIVLDQSFFPGKEAMMLPKTDDGRVLFAVPWHGKVLAGTTDIPVNKHSEEPVASKQEIDFILSNLGKYLTKKPQISDILSVFSGLRPLAIPHSNDQKTKEISRGHKLIVSPSGLLTITGGKWTTYRKMAEDTVDKAISIGKLKKTACITRDLKIHGYTSDNGGYPEHLRAYGSDADKITALSGSSDKLSQKLHPDYPYTCAEVVWAVREEMAVCIEDFLARRIRLLFMDTRAALSIAPEVARIMAEILGKDTDWIEKEVSAFSRLASNYLP